MRINIANQYGVYMHDTPYKSVFGSEYRFDSSGCARVQNVRDLCAWILQGTEYTREHIDEVIRSGERVDAQPVAKLPVYWTYITAWATPEGLVQFRDDVYNKDGYGIAGRRDQGRAGVEVAADRNDASGRSRSGRGFVGATLTSSGDATGEPRPVRYGPLLPGRPRRAIGAVSRMRA